MNVATGVPVDWIVRSSGSAVRLPTIVIVVSPAITVPFLVVVWLVLECVSCFVRVPTH